MALIDLIEESVVRAPLKASDKNSALRELVETLATAGKILEV